MCEGVKHICYPLGQRNKPSPPPDNLLPPLASCIRIVPIPFPPDHRACTKIEQPRDTYEGLSLPRDARGHCAHARAFHRACSSCLLSHPHASFSGRESCCLFTSSQLLIWECKREQTGSCSRTKCGQGRGWNSNNYCTIRSRPSVR